MRNHTFIDLFAGCGGLSLGLMQAGWKGVFAVEKSPDAFQTLSHNFCKKNSKYKFDWPDWLPCEPMSIQQILSKHTQKIRKLRGKIDLIAGGPPCQGFSYIGLRNPRDHRNRLTSEYIKVVDLIRPRFLLLENVKGFQTAFKNGKKPYSLKVKKRLENLKWGGYHVYPSMIEASKFGVPQPRSRFIMLAVRKDIGKFINDPFEFMDSLIPDFRKKKRLNGHSTTVLEAIGDLEVGGKDLIGSLDGKGFREIKYEQPEELSPYQKLMRKGVPSGYIPNSIRLPNHKPTTLEKFKTVLKVCPKGISVSKEHRKQLNMKKHSFTPLHPKKLAATVTTLPDDTLHYKEPRILTVRENARLQSFPDWFSFQGKYTTGGNMRKKECPRYTQVGNAVPPLMAEAIGLTIKKLLPR